MTDPTDPANLFYLGANPDNPEEQFGVTERARAVHHYVVGGSGVGKSKMLQDWILQDVMAGRGCAVIDPKGDLVFDILAALSALEEVWWPALAERVVLIDPADPHTTAAFNPLDVTHGASPARLRQELYSIFRKVWGLSEGRTPRLELVLRRTLHLLMDAGLTLVEMPRVLSDDAYREQLLQNTTDQALRNFWLNEFPRSDAARFQWTSGIVTRIESFLDDPAMRSMVSGRGRAVDFRKAMDSGSVLLASLARGKLGEETSFLLGGFLTTKLQLAAESRVSIWPPERRRRFYIYADEFQQYSTSSLGEMLADARGYGVSLVMAHQNMAQLDPRLQEAILANAKIKAAFRQSHGDARSLSEAMFRVRGDRVKSKELAWIKLGRVPIPIGFNYDYFSASEEARQNRDALQYLPDRHLWVHVADSDALVRLRTVEMPAFDRRVADERVGRFKAALRDARPHGRLPTQQRQLPRLQPAGGRTRYEWLSQRGGRGLPRLRDR